MSRLALALEGAPLPQGRVLAYGPPVEALADLPRGVSVVQPDFSGAEAARAAGFEVAPKPEGQAEAALVFLPRAKALARAWLADAARRLPPGAPIWLDGAKTDGIDSLLKELRARGEVSEPFSKAHGKAFAFSNPGADALADWAARPRQIGAFTTMPGVFSADGVDPGSALLAAHLPPSLPKRVVDLGAGWGYLSAAILARPGVEHLWLVEADHTALEAAQAALSDSRARFHWADALRFDPGEKVEAVVMNPPFHRGRAPDPALGAGFIRAAAAMLTAGGTLWMVANRNLPYEATLAAHFRARSEVAAEGGYKVIRATGPSTRPLTAGAPSSR